MASTVAAWPAVALSEVLRQDTTYISELEPRLYPKLSVPWWGKGVVMDPPTDGSLVRMSRHQLAEPGQVIVSEIWAKHGSIGIVPTKGAGALVTSHFFLFNIDDTRLMREYMGYLITANYLTDQIAAIARGSTGYASIRPHHFLSLTVPLPPLEEQRRIVARIEALAVRIAEARGLRQAALAEAEGLLQSAITASFSPGAVGQCRTVELGEIGDIRAGVTLGRVLTSDTIRVPYLRVANVQDGHLNLDIVKEVAILPNELDKWRLFPGDILLTEGGDWDKLGRGTVWQGEIADCIHQNHIFRIRIDAKQFIPRFVAEYIGSRDGKAYFQSAAKQTTNLASINQRQLKAFPVLSPPLVVQQTVLERIDAVRANLQGLRRMQTESAVELDALLPSALDRAFRGEL